MGQPPPVHLGGEQGNITIRAQYLGLVVLVAIASLGVQYLIPQLRPVELSHDYVISQAQYLHGLERCAFDQRRPETDYSFAERRLRTLSAGSNLMVLKNATLINGDGVTTHNVTIRLRDGIVHDVTPSVACIESQPEQQWWASAGIQDLHGRYVTPGLVDMHSHVGVRPEPAFWATEDVTEMVEPVTSWGRAIDALKPNDARITALAAGGITTSLVLTGASNLISGEGLVIKMKETFYLDELRLDTTSNGASPKPHRYLKMACGENIKGEFQSRAGGPNSRIGESFFVREAYEEAARLKGEQERWCEAASLKGRSYLHITYPASLKTQTLVDVLRGDIFVNAHCYEAQDVHSLYNHADEFGFNITALHHALEAHHLIDEIKNHGTMLATFSDEWGFKKEVFGANSSMLKIVTENGIPVALTSDHPAKAGQFLMYEAQIGHHYGLNESMTVQSLTSVPANALGLDNRIGYIRPGYDADLVVWDRMPLRLGAKPLQVILEGKTRVMGSAALWEESLPRAESRATAPPSRVQITENKNCSEGLRDVVLRGITKTFLGNEVRELGPGTSTVLVRNGSVECIGDQDCEKLAVAAIRNGVHEINVENGHIIPGLTVMTRYHGLSEILNEPSTMDGRSSGVIGSPPLAINGLMFGGEHLSRAHRAGLTRLVTPPSTTGLMHGISVAFRPGASSILDEGAISSNFTALHFSIGQESKTLHYPTISSQIAAVRALLLETPAVNHSSFSQAMDGRLPVVIHTQNADVISHIILLKRMRPQLDLVIMGGAEAHLHASALASSNISVILSPWLCNPQTWEQRRCLATPPLEDQTTYEVLKAAGVRLALGNWDLRQRYLRNAIWEASWVAGAGDGNSDRELEAVSLLSYNVADILGLEKETSLVVFQGNPFQFGASVALVLEQGGVKACWPDVE